MTEAQRASVRAVELKEKIPRLHSATWLGYNELVEEFIRGGDDPNSLCHLSYRTALAIAVNANRFETARLLLRYGADPNFPKDDSTVIRWGLAFSDEMAQLLIDSGVDVTTRPREGASPLHWAVNSRRSAEIIRSLVERGAGVFFCDDFGRTPLECAQYWRSHETIAYLTPLTRDRPGLMRVFCTALAFAPMRLPPCVVLAIIDWLTIKVSETTFRMSDVPYNKKIRMVIGVQTSYNKTRSLRENQKV